MNKPSLQIIKDRMILMGMTVFEKPFDMTLGGIRTKDNASNEFNDWLFMMFHDEEGNLCGIIEKGTTDAGLYYRLNPINIDGTAIIMHDLQHRGAYTYMEKGGHKGQEAFRQTGNMIYVRDANRDEYLDFTGEKLKGIFATNGHDMGTAGKQVNKWSAGCWGSTQQVMDKFYALARLQNDMGNGDKFSFALLHENSFE